MILVLLLLFLPARAQVLEGEPEDIRVSLADGVVVNWTRLVLEVTTSAWPRGVDATTKVTEHEARQRIAPRVSRAVGQIPATSTLTVQDLFHDATLGDPTRARAERWVVGEARYHASGRVLLVGELSLQDLFKPWTLASAPLAPTADRQPSWTGLLLDARGTDVVPAYRPRILYGHDVLWEGILWDDVALFQDPVVYVPDPAHPASARAGHNPLVLRIARAERADLHLEPDDAIRFRTGMQQARIIGEGTVVVVIDP